MAREKNCEDMFKKINTVFFYIYLIINIYLRKFCKFLNYVEYAEIKSKKCFEIKIKSTNIQLDFNWFKKYARFTFRLPLNIFLNLNFKTF